MRPVTSWGRLHTTQHRVAPLSDPEDAPTVISRGPFPGIAHGAGRSYGDVCLNPGHTLWDITALNHFVSFDEKNGLLTCEAGVLLRDIQQTFIPRGWALPVTPGTQMVTIAGAIANDVHGKNHHRAGSFGNHVQQLKLARTDGTVLVCSPKDNADWLAATVGGLGLTGVIIEATIRLTPVKGPWLDIETTPYTNLDEFFQLADESEADWEHTVSWVDCTRGQHHRGIFMRGNPSSHSAQASDGRELTMPFTPPVSLVNRLSLRPFNAAYYHLQKAKAGRKTVHYKPFFYPLDSLHHWNRMYGPRGFYQYQTVIPHAAGKGATETMLSEISGAGEGSFLAVLKTFGNRQALGMLSFPQPGVALALDFPNRGERTLKLFSRLNHIVREAGGRIYPAKDACMPKDLFEAGYPRLEEFKQYRDPGISSALSRRLMEE